MDMPKVAKKPNRCSGVSCAEDADCCMEMFNVNRIVPATCKSMKCLFKELLTETTSFEGAKQAALRNDRHMYFLIVIVGVLSFVVFYRARSPRHNHPIAWPQYNRGLF